MPTALGDLAERFLAWVDTARLDEVTRKFYRLAALKATPILEIPVKQITGRLRRAIEIFGLGRKCQLRFADTATNAPRSGGVEDDRPRSKNQNDEEAWAASSA